MTRKVPFNVLFVLLKLSVGWGVGQGNGGGRIEVKGFSDNTLALGIRTLELLFQRSCWLHSSNPGN